MDIVSKTLEKTVDKMSSYTTNSDVKQIFAVMGNEIIKFMRGKKIYIYLAIIGLLIALDVGIALMVPDSNGHRLSLLHDGDTIASSELGNLYLILIIILIIRLIDSRSRKKRIKKMQKMGAQAGMNPGMMQAAPMQQAPVAPAPQAPVANAPQAPVSPSLENTQKDIQDGNK